MNDDERLNKIMQLDYRPLIKHCFNLEKENDRLKEELEEYKSRCEKALEYLNGTDFYRMGDYSLKICNMRFQSGMYHILSGDDNNQSEIEKYNNEEIHVDFEEDYDNEDYDYFKEWDIEQAKLEIERLNSIINELEKTLERLIEENLEGYKEFPENWEERRSVSNTWLSHRDSYLCILNYLQELKGSDKE